MGALLGVARAYLMLKQSAKAKQLLKRVAASRQQWTLHDADHLEQCWLLLADQYIAQAKHEQATELLNACLQHNQVLSTSGACVDIRTMLCALRSRARRRWNASDISKRKTGDGMMLHRTTRRRGRLAAAAILLSVRPLPLHSCFIAGHYVHTDWQATSWRIICSSAAGTSMRSTHAIVCSNYIQIIQKFAAISLTRRVGVYVCESEMIYQ